MSRITIEGLVQRSNEVQWAISKEIEQLEDHQITQKPAPNQWSVAEVLSHLNLTFDHYFPKINEVIVKAPSHQVDSYNRSFLVGLFSDWQKPKKGKRKMKAKTFTFLEPGENDSAAIYQEFISKQEEFCELIKLGRTHDLSKIKVVSAIGPILKFTLPECFDFLLSHEERHLCQIREIVDSIHPDVANSLKKV